MSPWVLNTILFVGAWVGLAALSTGLIGVAAARLDRAKAERIHGNN
jgi:hypothetical protein